MNRLILGAVLALTAAAPALAQDHAGHTEHGEPVGLPAICTENVDDAATMAMPEMATPNDLDAGHRALIDSMGGMHADMAAGMTAKDVDVAFVCGMIPHHRGAIAMAQAELEHGDDPWARELASAIIAAQEKEIADMMAWLDEQSGE